MTLPCNASCECSCLYGKPDLHLLLITEGVVGNLDELEFVRTAALVWVLFSDQKFKCPPYLYHNASFASR